jgi:UDP-glucose 4-epimerase
VTAKFMQALSTGTTPVFYGSGLQTRDFVFVRDVAEAVRLLCRLLPSETEPRFEPINISSGRQTTIAELYQLLQSAIRVDRAPIIDKPRPGDVHDSCLANDRARDALGWAPRWSLPDGIAATFQASDYACAQVAEG